jgi:serine/threonine protein kinase
MAPELASDQTTRERFVREARVGALIDSDHVVEVVTAGVDEQSGAPYLVMELLRGEELADIVARLGPLPLGDVAEVMDQAGHCLEQAHAKGIVHRDLKPENVFPRRGPPPRRLVHGQDPRFWHRQAGRRSAGTAQRYAGARHPALHAARAD